MSDNVKNGVTYGCHIDLSPGERPDGCVLDYGCPSDCIMGTTASGRDRKSKWGCPYWKPDKWDKFNGRAAIQAVEEME